MSRFSDPVFWLVSLAALALVVFWLRGHFGPETRARCRRDKSHRRIVSKRPGPAIKLAVNVGQAKRGGLK